MRFTDELRGRLLRTLLRTAALCAALAATAGCNFTVTSPGRITESDLASKDAAPVILNGLIGDAEVSINNIIVDAGLASDELGFSGTRSWYSFFSRGDLRSADTNVLWDPAATASFTTEDGVTRLTKLLGADDEMVAQANLWAGFALRFQGDVFCQAVFDGGPPLPDSAYYSRALGHFKAAEQLAATNGDDTTHIAAIAGEAQVNLMLGHYADAAAEAALVPDDFLFVAHRSTTSDREQNLLWFETFQQSQLTVYGTPIADLGPDGDPRTPWKDMNKLGAGGDVAFYRQLKYSDWGSPIPLAKGWEMRLIQAEVMLRDGDVGGAVNMINYVRDHFGVPEVTATTADAAWQALDHERLVTLWLEGRRFRDDARFLQEGHSTFLQGRDVCFPFSDSEINSNPNLSH